MSASRPRRCLKTYLDVFSGNKSGRRRPNFPHMEPGHPLLPAPPFPHTHGTRNFLNPATLPFPCFGMSFRLKRKKVQVRDRTLHGGRRSKRRQGERGDEKSQVPGEHFNLGARREPCEAQDSTICFSTELYQCPPLKIEEVLFLPASSYMIPKSAAGEFIANVVSAWILPRILMPFLMMPNTASGRDRGGVFARGIRKRSFLRV